MFLTALASQAARYALPVCVAVVATTTAYAPLATAADATAADLPDTVATVQDQKISAEELTTSLRGELLQLDMQRYRTLKEGLDEIIAEKLITLEAEKRQMSPEQLMQEEVAAKVKPVTEEEAKQFYEANQERIRQPYDQVAPRLRDYLSQQERQKQQQSFLRDLRQRYKVNIALQPPKVDVDIDDDPMLGDKDAPVTIVEFSDFQCPYCRRVQPALKRLMEEYEGKVRLVFRDFPLRSIHPQAQKAAEAAQCADDQDKFWPYHDKLFEQTALQIDDLKRYAKELGLDMAAFSQCLESDKHAAEVEKDLQDGRQVGVNSTPSFYINGQPLSGAAAYENFQELVDEALENHQSARN
jgi:protein-disulfide isomerase